MSCNQTIPAFCCFGFNNYYFVDFHLLLYYHSSVSWSTTSFVNLSALYSSFSLLIRVELGVQGLYLFRDGHQNNFYRAVTAHGLGMVFLFIMPGVISSMGNLHLPTLLRKLLVLAVRRPLHAFTCMCPHLILCSFLLAVTFSTIGLATDNPASDSSIRFAVLYCDT